MDKNNSYIIRYNISNIINFTLLTPTLHSFDYGGPITLKNIDAMVLGQITKLVYSIGTNPITVIKML